MRKFFFIWCFWSITLFSSFNGEYIYGQSSLNGNSYSDKDKMFYTFGFGDYMDDSTAKNLKVLGVTSVESYVTWESVEGDGEGMWDWSKWDKMVEVLKRNNLKWVPFLILGPAYSLPEWYRRSNEHIPSRCLEDGIASKIESRWNPYIKRRIEVFIGRFSERYSDYGVIESVLLGIQGDFGESIYSVTGGGWTFNLPGTYHNHPGFWCNDIYALHDFQDKLIKKYKSLENLNKSWETNYARKNEIDFPGYGDNLKDFQALVKKPGATKEQLKRWLDFIDWYREAMTLWSDWWIGEARNMFSHLPIYLCTGGDAIPEHGANFAEQSRVAAIHNAGIRITNEGSDYKNNFVLTRWVASASKYYGAYFGFEPAGPENEKGIVNRIYNATASGANQLHDYSTNITSSKDRVEVQKKNLKYLIRRKPLVDVALFYPNVSLTINRDENKFFEKVGLIRDIVDYDYLDESMLRNGALNGYRILIMPWGKYLEDKDVEIIFKWVENGGELVIENDQEFVNLEGKAQLSNLTNARKGNGSQFLSESLNEIFNKLKIPYLDFKMDEVFSTRIGEREWLILNEQSTKEIKISYWKKNRIQNKTVNVTNGINIVRL